MKKCVIYKRTSSLANSGEDKDSHQRQEKICTDYCKSNNLEMVKVFYDVGVSGKISVLRRDGFKELYLYCIENEIRTIVFESTSRFSRDSFELELAYRRLVKEGFTLISATSDTEFDDRYQSKLVRQILSAISEYQREEIVFNLSVARERKKGQNKKIGQVTMEGQGKCEGRKTHRELNPELVKLVKRLRRRNWKTKKQKSYRQISRILFEDYGLANDKGKPSNPKTIMVMVSQ